MLRNRYKSKLLSMGVFDTPFQYLLMDYVDLCLAFFCVYLCMFCMWKDSFMKIGELEVSFSWFMANLAYWFLFKLVTFSHDRGRMILRFNQSVTVSIPLTRD